VHNLSLVNLLSLVLLLLGAIDLGATVNHKPLFKVVPYLFGYKDETGECTLVNFKYKPINKYINEKVSSRTLHINHSKNKIPVLRNAIPVLGVKPKWGRYVLWSYFKIDLCPATSMESSRRDLWNDVAEHRSIVKSY